MATTIRVYLDGGATPAATAQMNADRTFSVAVPGVPDGVHSFEVTAQEDGKAESPRVIQSNITVAHGTTQHPLVGDATGTGSAAGDLAAPGAPPTHPLAGDLVGTGTASADLTAPKLHPLAGDASGTGAAVADLTAPGAGGSGPTYVGAGAVVSQSVSGDGSVSIPLPAGNEGDVLIIHAGVFGTPETGTDQPAGWSGSGGFFHKRRAAGETSANIGAHSFWDSEPSPGTFKAKVYVFRLPSTSGGYLDPPTANPVGGTTTSSTIVGSAMTTTGPNAMAVLLAFGTGASSPGGSVNTLVVEDAFLMAYDSAPSSSAGAKPAPTLALSPAAEWSADTFFLKGT